jgi:hypothetical protein
MKRRTTGHLTTKAGCTTLLLLLLLLLPSEIHTPVYLGVATAAAQLFIIYRYWL